MNKRRRFKAKRRRAARRWRGRFFQAVARVWRRAEAEADHGARRPYYALGVDGEPVHVPDVLVWAAWFETADRIVARTAVGAGCVSTVFLGIDHNFYGGPPLLWGTMTFDVPGLQHAERRYASRDDALLGHEAAVCNARLALQVNEVHA